MAGSHRGRTRSLPFPCGECPVTCLDRAACVEPGSRLESEGIYRCWTTMYSGRMTSGCDEVWGARS